MSADRYVVRVESAGVLGSVGRFVRGYVRAKVATVAVLALAGILLIPHHERHGPVPARQQIEQRHEGEVLVQEYEAEQREVIARATPGPPFSSTTPAD